MKRTVLIFFIFIIIGIINYSIFAQNMPTTNEVTLPSAGSMGPIYTLPQQVVKHNISNPTSPFIPSYGAKSLPLGTNIEAFNFDDNATVNNGHVFIPPDPYGAAGIEHVVNVVNTGIEWYEKNGTQQHQGSLKSFFSSLNPHTYTFDPKVIYDQYEDRFVVITLEKESSPARSRIFVAVSATSDPNGTWYYLDIDALETIGGDESWADYPGLAVDEEAIYITANMFAFSGGYKGSRVWIIDKGVSGGFYGGGAASYNKYDPYALAGIPNNAVTTQPAHVFDAPSGDFGTYLVAYSGYHSGSTEYLLLILINNPLSSPSFTYQWVNCGDFDDNSTSIQEAPQSGSAYLINTGDRRALNAVWRNNFLYTAANCMPSSGADVGQTTAHWFKLSTSTPTNVTLYDQGHIGGEDIATNCYTFYPSIAVDRHGNIGLGFSASASSIYPGAYYTGRLNSDPAGTVQPSETLRSGLDYYYRAFGGSRNRWGDYTAICIDPSDDETFWVYNEYALTRGSTISGEDGRWGTAFGQFSFKVYANVKIFMEGPYNSGGMNTDLNSAGYLPLTQPYTGHPWNYSGSESVASMPSDIVDWVLIQLRTGTDSSTTKATRAALLRNDGQIVDQDGGLVKFEGIVPGNYYIVIRHRNHLDVMSANPVNLWSNSSLYNFTSGSTQFYGSNGAKEIDTGIWGMIAGDADGNGQVQTSDKNDYWWVDTGTAGYKSSDFDLNGQVQTSDKNDYWWSNSGLGTQVPF